MHSVLSAEASGCLQCKRHDGSAVDDIVSEPSAIEEFSARASEATEELSAPASEAWAHLRGPHSRLGTRLSAVDYKGTAYGATVIAVQYCQAQCNRVKVSFDGWGEAFDEWIPADSDRLFPEGSLDLVEAGVEGQLQGKQQLSTAQAANTAGPYPWIDAPGKAIGDGAEESGSGEGGDNLLEARICRELGRGWVRIKRVCTAKTRPYWIAPDGSRFQKHMLAKEYAGVTDTEAPARTVTEEDLGPPVQPMLTSDVGSVQGSNMDPEAPDPGSALDECIIPDPKADLCLTCFGTPWRWEADCVRATGRARFTMQLWLAFSTLKRKGVSKFGLMGGLWNLTSGYRGHPIGSTHCRGAMKQGRTVRQHRGDRQLCSRPWGSKQWGS